MDSATLNSPTLAQTLQKLAPQIGASILLHPDWPMVGQIKFRNGRTSYFKFNILDLNSLGSASISKDKDFATYFLLQQGYPVVPNSKAFYSKEYSEQFNIVGRGLDEAFDYAQEIGLPVVVKPNDGSQGVGVSFVSSQPDFYQSMEAIFAKYPIALVQSPVSGNDYRVVVLDGEIMAAYQRIPLNVIGDGHSTIEALFNAKSQKLAAIGRRMNVSLASSRVINKLSSQGFNLNSVIPEGERVYVLDNANLSAGGDAVEVTNQIHPKFAELCGQMARDMGLRYCGVDLMVQGEIANPPQQWWVIEVNGAPGLSHFAKLGPKQYQRVEELYLRILSHLEHGQPVPVGTITPPPSTITAQPVDLVSY